MKKEIKLSVDYTEIERLVIGARLYDALCMMNESINFHSIIKYDSQNKKFVIREDKLLELISLINRVDINDRTIEIV